METVSRAQQLIETASHPQGVNIGINVGRCAGAGLPGHLHVHLVPRWSADTNFITVVGGEPSLQLERVKKLYDQFWVTVVTNGIKRIPYGAGPMSLGQQYMALWRYADDFDGRPQIPRDDPGRYGFGFGVRAGIGLGLSTAGLF